MQMLSIVQSINLPINNVSLKVMDGKYGDFIYFEDIDNIKTIQDLDGVLEEQLPEA